MDLDGFVRDGYVVIRGAVDAETVAACRELIWAAMERRGVCRDDPGSWPPLLQGMDDLTGEPLLAAYTAPALTAAYDELIGPGRWERSVRSADIGETARAMFTRAGAVLGANWSLHDLRHSAAYRMARDPGMPLTDVQWVLGHAHLSTTQQYLNPLPGDVIEAVLAFHARQREPRPGSPPPPGYRADSLMTLFGKDAR